MLKSIYRTVSFNALVLWSRYTIREEIQPDGVLSDLSIKRTERSDSALFTCIATNSFGSDDSSINLIVQGILEFKNIYIIFIKSLVITHVLLRRTS